MRRTPANLFAGLRGLGQRMGPQDRERMGRLHEGRQESRWIKPGRITTRRAAGADGRLGPSATKAAPLSGMAPAQDTQAEGERGQNGSSQQGAARQNSAVRLHAVRRRLAELINGLANRVGPTRPDWAWQAQVEAAR